MDPFGLCAERINSLKGIFGKAKNAIEEYFDAEKLTEIAQFLNNASDFANTLSAVAGEVAKWSSIAGAGVAGGTATAMAVSAFLLAIPGVGEFVEVAEFSGGYAVAVALEGCAAEALVVSCASELASYGFSSASNKLYELAESKGSQTGNPVIDNMNNRVPNDEVTPPSNRGNAPISNKDGKPVEIHHENQNPEGPFDEMHPSDHRYGDNYKNNHSNYNDNSQIDRSEFRKWKRQYWEQEWDNGRWK